MYENINDYDLLDKVSDNEIATETLFYKYRPLINKIARTAYYKNQSCGMEINDIVQEGMIGFSTAVNTYDEHKDASFYTFARMCIIRRILTCISSANRQKHQILNESISVENISDDLRTKEKIFGDYDSDPEKLLVSVENVKELMDDIEKELTDFECEVFELKAAGFDYKEIAELLGRNPKSIDNAIFRIKAKVHKYLENKR